MPALFQRHFVLWRKGHYPDTTPIHAMRLVMAHVSGSELRFISDGDALSGVIGTYFQHVRWERCADDLFEVMTNIRELRLGVCTEVTAKRLLDTMQSRLMHTEKDELPPLGEVDEQLKASWITFPSLPQLPGASPRSPAG